ncbi:hypothetical protein O9992_19985 [Vibrio lentus]|nr:hypothetical protein [Vibrio lentus]
MIQTTFPFFCELGVVSLFIQLVKLLGEAWLATTLRATEISVEVAIPPRRHCFNNRGNV